MGSPVYEDGRGIDEGQHRVTVRSFFMGKYEVTQEEYQELMGTNPSHFRGFNLPVEQVSWYDAVEYCNRRSERDKLKPAYTKSRGSADCDWQANGYRLPTEAEWEYACRAGTASPYYTGCFVDKAGWYNKNSGGITHPVGQKEPNSWGLYDMHGNIWEWCWDWYGEYDLHPQTNPVGPAQGDTRVARGGSWDYGGGNVRSAVRYGKRFSLVNKGNSLGFRLVRSL
jgi:formylglycine-generating enzyme required for sulfatase activity